MASRVTPTSVVREFMFKNHATGVRVGALWDHLQSAHPGLVKSKSNLKTSILKQMRLRGEVWGASITLLVLF